MNRNSILQDSLLKVCKARGVQPQWASDSAFDQLAELWSYLDPVTGLLNSNYLATALQRKASPAGVIEEQALLFIDLDHFKHVNDVFGHRVGTDVLREFATQLQTWVRGSDTVLRYGGDEFVVVLSPCDRTQAIAVAERVCQQVRAQTWGSRENAAVKLTVSIGMAWLPATPVDQSTNWFDLAETALRSAKAGTRDCIRVAL